MITKAVQGVFVFAGLVEAIGAISKSLHYMVDMFELKHDENTRNCVSYSQKLMIHISSFQCQYNVVVYIAIHYACSKHGIGDSAGAQMLDPK